MTETLPLSSREWLCVDLLPTQRILRTNRFSVYPNGHPSTISVVSRRMLLQSFVHHIKCFRNPSKPLDSDRWLTLMNKSISPHHFEIILLQPSTRILTRLFLTRRINRISLMIPNSIFIFRPLKQFLKIRLVVKMNMLDIRISPTIKMTQIASQIISLMHRRKILKSLVKRMIRQFEIWNHRRIDNLNLWCIVSERLSKTEFSVLWHLADLLIPDLMNYVSFLLDLEKTVRVLRIPEEVIEYLVTVVKTRNYYQLSYPVFYVEFVEKLDLLLDFSVEVCQ